MDTLPVLPAASVALILTVAASFLPAALASAMRVLRARATLYKLALLTWAAAYAVITAILAAIGPTLAAWPLALLVLSALMVAALTWVVMPALTRLCRGWLAPNV